MAIPGARSYKQGQVSRDEALAAIAKLRVEYKVKHVTAALDELDDYDADLWIVDGDLHVTGDLNLSTEGAYLLAVLGDLVVDGSYADYDDPESFLLVTGSMRARDIVTAGWLEVHGDLVVDRLVGDYNDCAAYLGGDVTCRLFYGEEHHFTIRGALTAGVVLGRPRLEIASAPTAIPMTDARLLEHLDAALVRMQGDQVDGIKDFGEVKRRVLAGEPLVSR